MTLWTTELSRKHEGGAHLAGRGEREGVRHCLPIAGAHNQRLRCRLGRLVRMDFFKDPLADQLCIGKAFGLGKLPQGFRFIRM